MLALSLRQPRSPLQVPHPPESPAGSARSGGGSGAADSWNSQEPGTPNALGDRAKRAYDPYRETYTQYEERFKREAEILDATGFGLPLEEYEGRLLKARLHAGVVESQKGVKANVVRELKKDFRACAFGTWH